MRRTFQVILISIESRTLCGSSKTVERCNRKEGRKDYREASERASASARALVLLGTRGTAAFRRVLRHSPLERASERANVPLPTKYKSSVRRSVASPARSPQSGWAAGDRFVG